MIHPTADVQSLRIGEGTSIWQFAVILEGAIIGRNCNINCHTFIEGGASIGDNVTVKSGIYLWDGVTLEDNVFLGPNVVFTNDLHPRSKKRREFVKTLIKKGASIGANSSILAGVTIGSYAMVGMGSLVTKDVPDYALVYGQPAIQKGYVDETGEKLREKSQGIFSNEDGDEYILDQKNNLIKNK